MRHSLGFAIGLFIFIGLFTSAPIASAGGETSLAPAGDCSYLQPGQSLEIPADGSWLQVCFSDANAPANGTVLDVNVKYARTPLITASHLCGTSQPYQ